MSRQVALLAYFLALCERVRAADSVPIVTTVTLPTTSESLSTFTSAGVSTSIIQNVITTFVTTILGKALTITSALGDQTTVIPYTDTGISTVTVNTNTVVVSTVGFSTASSSDDPATKTAVSSSISTSSRLTDAPNLSTSTSDTSSSTTETQSTSTQSTSRSASTTSSRTTEGGSSTSSAAVTAAPHKSSPKAALTSGQKAGIGVGIAFGVIFILVLVAVIILWRHGLLSRRAHDDDVFDENEDFLHRPYSMLFNQKKQIEVQHDKSEAATQHLAYGSNPRLSTPMQMSGSTIHEHAGEDPVYLGVPSHLSGQKRWSKVPQRET